MPNTERDPNGSLKECINLLLLDSRAHFPSLNKVKGELGNCLLNPKPVFVDIRKLPHNLGKEKSGLEQQIDTWAEQKALGRTEYSCARLDEEKLMESIAAGSFQVLMFHCTGYTQQQDSKGQIL